MLQLQPSHKDAALRDLAARKTEGVSPPFYYHFHVHKPCNQKCIMCKPDGRHARDVVPFEMFESFVEKVRPYAEHITLIGGETLLYPWISEALALLAEAEVDVTICTNATQLNEKMISAMLPLKALSLRCSIDAATSETYFRIRGTNLFDRVTGNMRLFNQMTVDRPRLRQILNYVVMHENLHEVVPFVDLAVSLSSDEVQFNPVRHVSTWEVENGTGWVFRGAEQSCESFRDEYNSVMKEAATECEQRGVAYSVTLLR
jgi:MoaA/NifB/PqqE/SkfB family radical SAM enzyme